MGKHVADESLTTIRAEIQAEWDVEEKHRRYAADVIPAGWGKHRAVDAFTAVNDALKAAA